VALRASRGMSWPVDEACGVSRSFVEAANEYFAD
jgi:hypothetical protein